MRLTTRTMTNLLGAVLIAATSVACSERTEDRVERRADNAATATSNAATATGNAVTRGGEAADAAVQTMSVKTALLADSRVTAVNINVDSDHITKTVTLKGRVPTTDQKTLAGQIAVSKADGYQVRNELTIGR